MTDVGGRGSCYPRALPRFASGGGCRPALSCSSPSGFCREVGVDVLPSGTFSCLNGRWPQVRPPAEVAAVSVYFRRQLVPEEPAVGWHCDRIGEALYQSRSCGL